MRWPSCISAAKLTSLSLATDSALHSPHSQNPVTRCGNLFSTTVCPPAYSSSLAFNCWESRLEEQAEDICLSERREPNVVFLRHSGLAMHQRLIIYHFDFCFAHHLALGLKSRGREDQEPQLSYYLSSLPAGGQADLQTSSMFLKKELRPTNLSLLHWSMSQD